MFHDYIRDAIRQRTLSPSNPIYDDILSPSVLRQVELNDNTTITDARQGIPQFSTWQPYHLVKAWHRYQPHHDQAIQLLQAQAQAYEQQLLLHHDPPSCAQPHNHQPIMMMKLLAEWNRLSATVDTLHRCSLVMSLMAKDSHQQQQDWTHAWEEVIRNNDASLMIILPPSHVLAESSQHEWLPWLYESFILNWEATKENDTSFPIIPLVDDASVSRMMGSLSDDCKKDDTASIMRDIQGVSLYLLRRKRAMAKRQALDDDKQLIFTQNLLAVQNAQVRIQRMIPEDVSSSRPTKSKDARRELLDDTHTIRDLQNENAMLLGYDHYLHRVFQETARMASSDQQVRDLCVAAADILQPTIHHHNHHQDQKQQEFLEPLTPAKPTLDGALLALFSLLSNLLGIEIKEVVGKDRNIHQGWHRDNRIFHVYDECVDSMRSYSPHGLLGTIIMDPFQRPSKKQELPFTLSLRHRGPNVEPLVAVSLNITPPTWDDNSAAPIRWNDALCLFHEWGHAIQLVLSKSTIGGMLGADKLPWDVSEIMPKFMELCLFEESCLQLVMDFSNNNNSNNGISMMTNDRMGLLREWHMRQRTLSLMQHAFYSTLELELFASEGQESLPSLQRRLALQFIPHDLPDEDDLSPTLNVMQQNNEWGPIGMYRYLWAEVHSADMLLQVVSLDDSAASTGRLSLCGDHSGSVRERGRIFRERLLDPGASVDTKELLHKFHERNVDLQILLLDIYRK
jgi:Zn-dependent oligopeptidase